MRARLFPLVPAVLAAAALAPAALAVAEGDAGLLPGVERAWHLPDPLPAHTQWQGFLRLQGGGNVTGASFQVCRVGAACFAPPAPAERVDDRTFRFDTAAYLANGAPVDYQPGWRLGVKWVLDTAQGPRAVPPSACPGGDDDASCLDDEYLTLAVAGSPSRAQPFPWLAALAGLALAALVRRRHA